MDTEESQELFIVTPLDTENKMLLTTLYLFEKGMWLYKTVLWDRHAGKQVSEARHTKQREAIQYHLEKSL